MPFEHSMSCNGIIETPRGAMVSRKDYDDLRNAYDELIFAVESKFPGESRHRTALRYIKEREKTESVSKENDYE